MFVNVIFSVVVSDLGVERERSRALQDACGDGLGEILQE